MEEEKESFCEIHPVRINLETLGYLKHKKFRDSEARIVSVVAPSLFECELYCITHPSPTIEFSSIPFFRPNGVRFTAPAGTTEFVRRWQPKEEICMSFKHRGFLLSSHKPKLPTVYRLRNDLTWEDVCKKHKDKDKAPSQPSGIMNPKLFHDAYLYFFQFHR